MPDINTVVEGVSNTAQQGASVGGLIALIVLLMLCVGGIVFFFVYRSRFNIDIIHVPFEGGQPIITGLRAKDYFTGKGKEYRFKIYNARKNKIKYNEEAIQPNHIKMVKTASGKMRRLLWTTTDSSGMLIPANVTPQMIEFVKKTIDSSGKEVEEKVVTRVLQAKYEDVDVSWLQMEKDKWSHIFKTQDKMVFWGLIIVGIIMLLCLGGFLWGVSKNVEVAHTNADIASEQAKSNALIAETLCVITEKCLNETAGKPFNSIITT